jgi:hypothetical protein
VAEETQSPRDDADAKSDQAETIDISETTAPSIGPHTVIDREPAEDRLARHEQSDVDAMGLDKRREVMGQSYGPSFARQAGMYGIFLAVVAALVIGGKVLADKLDEPPKTNPDVAPWAAADAQQRKPAPIDFPRYGGVNTESDTAP